MRRAKETHALKRTNKLYLAVTPDKYEFPVFIMDNVHELAAILNLKVSSVQAQISRNNRGSTRTIGGYRVYTVPYEEFE